MDASESWPQEPLEPGTHTREYWARKAEDGTVSREALEKRIAEVKEALGPSIEWESKLKELHSWTASSWFDGDTSEDLRSDCYSFLCSLIGYLMCGLEAAALTDTIPAAAAEAHDAGVRREVLEELLTLCNRRATEAAAEGRKFSLDIHQGYEGWAEAQLAALDAPDNTNCGTKAANIPVSD